MELFAIFAMAANVSAWVVVAPVTNMYSRPSSDSPVVSQAILGTNVKSLEEQSGWIRIRTPDDYTGWTLLSSIQQREAGLYAVTGAVAEVRSLFANLYLEPDITKHAPLITAPFESRIEIIAEPEENQRRWISVRLPDNREAWIQRGDVTTRQQPVTIEETIDVAKRFIGLPYLWGGTSSFGFDCSGFMQMLGRRRGIILPRDSGPQSRWDGVEPVKREELIAGDLLYFGNSPEKITHTGMYIGNGEFIHATTYQHPAVQISRLEDPHWADLLVACRRLKAGGSR